MSVTQGPIHSVRGSESWAVPVYNPGFTIDHQHLARDQVMTSLVNSHLWQGCLVSLPYLGEHERREAKTMMTCHVLQNRQCLHQKYHQHWHWQVILSPSRHQGQSSPSRRWLER